MVMKMILMPDIVMNWADLASGGLASFLVLATRDREVVYEVDTTVRQTHVRRP